MSCPLYYYFFAAYTRRSLGRSSPNFATCSMVTHIYRIGSEIWGVLPAKNRRCTNIEISAQFRTVCLRQHGFFVGLCLQSADCSESSGRKRKKKVRTEKRCDLRRQKKMVREEGSGDMRWKTVLQTNGCNRKRSVVELQRR